MNIENGSKIVVWFSCGVASAVAGYMTLKLFGDTCDVRIVNTPIAEEDEDNLRFKADVEKWLGVKIETVVNQKYPESSAEKIWIERVFMSGPTGAPCTKVLKKEARYQYEKEFSPDYHVLGFTFDELKRHNKFILTERDNVIPVLIGLKLTKMMCHEMIVREGIIPPRVYQMGYPNGNCIGCVKATSPTYWNLVRKMHPEVFEARAFVSRLIGCKLALVKGKRVYLDELDPNEKGRDIKSMDFDCGIFCEEKELISPEDEFDLLFG